MKPDCYECKFRRTIPGNCNLSCDNLTAKVIGNLHGVRNGWFYWPHNFDPIWLQVCDGVEKKEG